MRSNNQFEIIANVSIIPRILGSQLRILQPAKKKEKENEKDEIEKESERDRQAASGLERFRWGFLSGMAAGAGFFYSKCEFLARGIFPPSPSSFLVHAQMYTRARTWTSMHVHAHMYVRLSATTEPETACRMRRS